MNINDESRDPLERELAALTELEGDAVQAPEPWRSALQVARPSGARQSPIWELASHLMRKPQTWAAAAVFVLVCSAAMFIPPMLGSSRGSRLISPPTPKISEQWIANDAEIDQYNTVTKGHIVDRTGGIRQTDRSDRESLQKSAADDRQVIRKATIDLEIPDVRAAFQKAALLINDGLGEFIENSQITGEGAAMRATMTLRVEAARLAEVRQRLRELGQAPGGKVLSENATGDDVTDRIVDLEARLRNERRVEQELLALFDSRKDAPLKEVLELREKLSDVRGQIEQLDAQRLRLGKLVSLATILITLSAEPSKPAEQKHSSLGDEFLAELAAAWESGLRSLGDSIAWIVRVAIGGLIIWILLAAAALAIIVLARRLLNRPTREPAPAN